MNPFIVYPLLILIVIGSFYQLYTYGSVDLSGSGAQTQNIAGGQTLNETETDIEVAGGSLSLDFTMTAGLVVIIIGAIVLSLIGLQVLGSGLDGFSVKIIWNGIVYYGLWSVFSVLAFNPINSIPIFGLLLWFFLTLFYTFGVFGKMGSEN